MKTSAMPSKIPALQSLASDVIGDGKSPNLFFVTDRGVTITVTRNFSSAHAEWTKLANRVPRMESALEDRKTGVIASVEPESDAPGARLIAFDDSMQFGYSA